MVMGDGKGVSREEQKEALVKISALWKNLSQAERGHYDQLFHEMYPPKGEINKKESISSEKEQEQDPDDQEFVESSACMKKMKKEPSLVRR